MVHYLPVPCAEPSHRRQGVPCKGAGLLRMRTALSITLMALGASHSQRQGYALRMPYVQAWHNNLGKASSQQYMEELTHGGRHDLCITRLQAPVLACSPPVLSQHTQRQGLIHHKPVPTCTVLSLSMMICCILKTWCSRFLIASEAAILWSMVA